MEDHGGELVLTDATKGRGAQISLKFPKSSVVPDDAPGTVSETEAVAATADVL